MSRIRFDGLSRNQQEELAEAYRNFSPHTTGRADITCRIYRLNSEPNINDDELTLDGQYAPKKTRHLPTGHLTVTGNNFQASLTLNASGQSSLGVVNEQELAYAHVIENYLRILTAHRVLEHGGVVLHSAGIVYADKAYLFCGRSNSGKTTLTRKAHKTGARILSDDINLVLPGKSGFNAYAVPFTGEFGRTLDHAGGKECYPLVGIVLLEQGDRLQTLAVGNAMAVARLLSGCPFVNTDEFESEALFDSVTALATTVPVTRLLNRRDDSIEAIMLAIQSQFGEIQCPTPPSSHISDE